MVIFGLTGGSGAGKSAVSEMFKKLGIYVVDTDKLSRLVSQKGTQCLDELVNMFGYDILKPDGTLNRKKLGAIVFGNEKKLKILNRITHHYIKYAIMQELNGVDAEYAAIDGAVIIGSPVEQLCSFIVTVDADYGTRMRRVIKRDEMSPEYAEARLKSQMPSEEYRKRAEYVIDNNGTVDELREKVIEVVNKIKNTK